MTVRSTLVIVIDLGVTGAAGFGNICLKGRAGRVLAAENAVRTVTALAVGGDKQALLTQCEAVDRIHVMRVNAGQALLGGHRAIAMALSAGFWNV